FFFSSRRRHTRFSRDWSSDVCSSDLNHPSRLWLEAADVNVIDPRDGKLADSCPAPSGSTHLPGVHELLPNGVQRFCRSVRVEVRSEERRVGKEGRGELVRDHDAKKKA